jgi:hypothetical protein
MQNVKSFQDAACSGFGFGLILGSISGVSLLVLNRIKSLAQFGFGTGLKQGFVQAIGQSTSCGAIVATLVGSGMTYMLYDSFRKCRAQSDGDLIQRNGERTAQMIEELKAKPLEARRGVAMGAAVVGGGWIFTSFLASGIVTNSGFMNTLKLSSIAGAVSVVIFGGAGFLIASPGEESK